MRKRKYINELFKPMQSTVHMFDRYEIENKIEAIDE